MLLTRNSTTSSRCRRSLVSFNHLQRRRTNNIRHHHHHHQQRQPLHSNSNNIRIERVTNRSSVLPFSTTTTPTTRTTSTTNGILYQRYSTNNDQSNHGDGEPIVSPSHATPFIDILQNDYNNTNDDDDYTTHSGDDEKDEDDAYLLLQPYRDRVDDLLRETTDLLDADRNSTGSSSSNGRRRLELLERWYDLSSCMVDILTSSSSSDKSSSSMSSMSSSSSTLLSNLLTTTTTKDFQYLTIQCAHHMDRILQQHILLLQQQPQQPPSNNNNHDNSTKPFSLTINAWRQSSHSSAGSKAATVLSQWGELYGGDLDLAPSIVQFNVVLDAYARSSYRKGWGGGDHHRSSNYDAIHEEEEEGSPAENAWEIYTLLSQSNDSFLRPNAITCSHVIHALRNHAFITQYSSSPSSPSLSQSTTNGDDSTTSSSTKTMDAEIASIRAYAVWKQMMDSFDASSASKSSSSSSTSSFFRDGNGRQIQNYNDEDTVVMDDDDTTTKNKGMALFWRAHLDILGLSANGLLQRRRDDRTDASTTTTATTTSNNKNNSSNNNTKRHMMTLGNDTEDLLRHILEKTAILSNNRNHNTNNNDTTDNTRDHGGDDILKDAYLSTMIAWCKEQEARIQLYHQQTKNNTNNEDDDDDDTNEPDGGLVQATCQAALSTSSLLNDLKEDLHIAPTPDHYNAVIHAHANCLEPCVLDKDSKRDVVGRLEPHVACMALLDELEELVDDANRTTSTIDGGGGDGSAVVNMKIRATTYGRVIWTYLQSLHHLQNNHNTNNTGNNEVLLATAATAEKALEQMINRYQTTNTPTKTTITTTTDNNNNYNNSNTTTLQISSPPQQLTYAINCILAMYCRCDGGYAAMKRSGRLFRRFGELQRWGHSTNSSRGKAGGRKQRRMVVVQPDAMTYGAYLTTLSRSDAENAGSIAYDIIKGMEERYSKGDKRRGGSGGGLESTNADAVVVKPNMVHYSAAIKALCKDCDEGGGGGNTYSRRGNKGSGARVSDTSNRNSSKAYELLNGAERLYDNLPYDQKILSDYNPVVLYSAVLSGWSSSTSSNNRGRVLPPGIGDKAIKILDRLQDKYNETLDEKYKPDLLIHSLVLKILSNERDGVGLTSAMQLLERMETRYREGEKDMMPNKFCYTAVITGWGRSGKRNAPEKMAQLLERMEMEYRESNDESVRPDTVAYTVMIDAWSRSRDPNAVSRAESILRIMEESKDFDTKPTVMTYTSVINCLWRHRTDDGGERAEDILNRMEERYKLGHFEAKPDFMAYTSAINAWASGKSPEKAKRAWNLFLKMQDRYKDGDLSIKPNDVSLTAVMNACAHIPKRSSTEHQQDALRIALEAQNILLQDGDNSNEYGTANSVTFKTLIIVFGKLIPSGAKRRHFVSVAFERCCEEGQVDESILRVLETYTPDLHAKLPANKELPNEWSRNVRKGRRSKVNR